ncbi:hypothetical protein DUI87_20573 [Hirundo rustica rustica]|uniref:Uncharacterized protein n=1 Tax=Hirundo rustica rustica TaxID=333673 RepID=A0A3M0JQW5_HIRRU|nr:hypothetical protein DUI87_20573 [Hirundo rustica rustica]
MRPQLLSRSSRLFVLCFEKGFMISALAVWPSHIKPDPMFAFITQVMVGAFLSSCSPEESTDSIKRQQQCPDQIHATMPHFLDWFVPVYLVISILILVGFGACIYYFEPGLQEAHKWRTQRPIMERDLRKTLMIRDNLAFGVPEV